jgi:multiple sugar transport system permease protein
MNKVSEKTNGLLNFMDLKQKNNLLLYWIMKFLLILLSLVCILPILWIILSAFKTPEEMYKIPPQLLPSSFSIDPIVQVLSKVNFFKYFYNTIIEILGALVFDIVINGLAGYVLSRIRPKGSALLETIVFGTMLLPSVSMVPLYMTFVDMPIIHVNLTGSFVPLWLQAGCNAFTIMLFRNFFNGIPMDYLEAARIDGCSNIKIFFKVILPLSKPIIVVESIFCVINSWKNFMWPYLILGSTPKETVSILLYQISSGNMSITMPEIMLVVMLSIIPPGIFYAIFSKQIMGGMNMSGIKG